MCFEATAANTQALGNTAVALQAVGLVTSTSGSYYKSKADKAAYEYQAAVQRNAGQIDEWRARDALERGKVAEINQRAKTSQVAGAQAARFAARGLAFEGSPMEVLAGTEAMGEADATTIRDNASREAWALRQSAATSRSNADLLMRRARAESPGSAAFTSLLGGAGAVASSWYRVRTGRY
jgi:hypothetical protein